MFINLINSFKYKEINIGIKLANFKLTTDMQSALIDQVQTYIDSNDCGNKR